MEEAMSIHARFACKLLAVVACMMAVDSTTAHAADNARYVSITGNNANACTLAAPCRSLQRGIQATPPGGELRILDSGAYGNNATVNKSMTISGNGNTVFLAKPITINQADAVVALRGLVLNGQGAALDGIRIDAAAAVHIERCVIHGFTQNGIFVSGNGIEVFVSDSISRHNSRGVIMAGAARLTIDNSHFNDNGVNGIEVQSGHAAISRGTASGNTIGIMSSASVSATSMTAVHNSDSGFRASFGGTLAVESSVAYGNRFGLLVEAGSTARISNSTFTANETGISNSGSVGTRQNNTVRGNTTSETSGNPLTPVPGV
jgi:hypothetical protein